MANGRGGSGSNKCPYPVILSTSLPGVFAATTSPFGYSSSPEEEKSVTNVSINPINYHLSNKQIYIRFIRAAHIRGHSADADFIQQFLALYTHHIHGHLAGNELHAVVKGLLPE